ncbi:glycosyltransferase family 4 protein [Sphingomonas astaxanthinifaciens]|uniref:Glycosyl transferase n=1 Tax=Sphingomonas astaxanthinifaciens DSM 22298 TaxID=1123267 RepID=A0ABQ5Z858_9SPHN|nr:glycosyltransferase family 4 protein [Sphingomonas astaxanthinifaciens]GLR46974.1 glycosyl transferase [Sphingomonas astaxanthinifaciens DSM 22298]
MRVLAFTRYDRDAASTRYRLLEYLPALAEAGFAVEWHPLLGEGHMKSLVAGKGASPASLPAAYARRARQLTQGPRPDLLWVYGELFPYLPAALEQRLMPRGVPVIYDWDDAFHLAYEEHRRPLVRRLLGNKFGTLLRSAAGVTCGNPLLQEHIGRYCANTLVVPTVVETERWRPAERDRSPVIGWIGSPSTWANMKPLLPALAALHRETGVRVRAIGAGAAAEADRFDGLDLVEWSEATEIAEVQLFSIGIMPLIDRGFERGKSGFKLIQYMACGLPVVASPVGVNVSIVRPEINGLLATTEAEWVEGLRRLIADPALCARFGAEGRRIAVAEYSLASQAPRVVELFRSVAPRR